MRYAISFLALIILQGCKDGKSPPALPNGDISLSELIGTKGELKFADSRYGTCTIRFQKRGKVVFDSLAYSICKYEGTFREEGGVILISIDTFYENAPFLDGRTDPDVVHLPALKLQQTSQGLDLIRKDGRTDFNEHWNIYPLLDGETGVFPFRLPTGDPGDE